MRVFEIYNKEKDESYFVKNKIQFCRDKGLTRRLLDYTFEGKRSHHKGYIIRQKLEFIPSLDGEKLLYDSDELGYFITPINGNNDIQNINLEEELKKANKKIQSLTDKLRIQRKINRKDNRQEIITDKFINDVVELLKDKIDEDIIIHEDGNEKCIFGIPKEMIVQLSDCHIGRTIDLPINKFNFEIARQRLKLFSKKIKEYIKCNNIDKVTIAFTGDIANTLDTYYDSIVSNEDNRANCFVESIDIFTDFINTIRAEVSSVGVVGITGNESRIRTSDFHPNTDVLANNNFDTLLCKVLKRLFKKTNVYFINDCDSLNYVFKVGKFNIAMTHGDKLGKQTNDDILKFKIRMIESTNKPVDYVIFGHIHSTLITSNYARSSSLCGMDAYAYNGLNISQGIASQNIYIIDEDITAIEIKLQ